MKKKDLLKRLSEKAKRKPNTIKVKLDFDVDQDGAPDHYKTGNKHSNQDTHVKSDFYSDNFNDEGTNVRPLHHPEKKYGKNKHSGDDHLSHGNEFKVSKDNLPTVGHDNWSGDDHMFEIIDEISSRILLEGAVKQNKKYLLKKNK